MTIEIDFTRYNIQAPAAIYMHPDQVHRIIGFDNVTVCAWAMTNETLHPEYLKLLEQISPTAPVLLNPETYGLLSEAASHSLKIAERKKDQFYQSLLKNHSNALVGLL